AMQPAFESRSSLPSVGSSSAAAGSVVGAFQLTRSPFGPRATRSRSTGRFHDSAMTAAGGGCIGSQGLKPAGIASASTQTSASVDRGDAQRVQTRWYRADVVRQREVALAGKLRGFVTDGVYPPTGAERREAYAERPCIVVGAATQRATVGTHQRDPAHRLDRG